MGAGVPGSTRPLRLAAVEQVPRARVSCDSPSDEQGVRRRRRPEASASPPSLPAGVHGHLRRAADRAGQRGAARAHRGGRLQAPVTAARSSAGRRSPSLHVRGLLRVTIGAARGSSGCGAGSLAEALRPARGARPRRGRRPGPPRRWICTCGASSRSSRSPPAPSCAGRGACERAWTCAATAPRRRGPGACGARSWRPSPGEDAIAALRRVLSERQRRAVAPQPGGVGAPVRARATRAGPRSAASGRAPRGGRPRARPT